MEGTHRVEVLCEVLISEDEVWDFLDMDKEESGYELTKSDYEEAAKEKFLDDDFTYYDFKLKN